MPLDNGKFVSLTLLSFHIPPWENEALLHPKNSGQCPLQVLELEP